MFLKMIVILKDLDFEDMIWVVNLMYFDDSEKEFLKLLWL